MGPRMSRVRLDPLQHVFEMRAYAEPVDTSLPLERMAQQYILVGKVTVLRDQALIELTHGEIPAGGLADLEAKLCARGVQEYHWERHLPDGTIRRVTRLIR